MVYSARNLITPLAHRLLWLFAVLAPALAHAQMNHRPTISYVVDQRITAGSFVAQSIAISDDDTAVNNLVVTVSSSNSGWYAAGNIAVSSTGATRTVTFGSTPGTTGVTTITLTVTDDSTPSKSSATAFVLQKASSDGGTVLQRIENWVMPVNTGSPTTTYGPQHWIVMDDASEGSFTLSAVSSNTTVVPNTNIAIGGTNYGRNVTVTPAASQAGRATITLTAEDGVGNETSTAFVIDTIGTDTAAPEITGLPTFYRQALPASSGVVSFTVSDSQTSSPNLDVSVRSSNQALVPDSGLALSGSSASRSVTVTPNSGTGATTISLTISDGDITRRFDFLYVVYDPAAEINEFARSNGVYILDSSGGTSYTTSFGKSVQLRDANLRDVDHVTGLALRMAWADVESSTVPGDYDFHIVENALDELPDGQLLSLLIVPNEPTYIGTQAAIAGESWDDNGTTRAQPWNAYLQARREALIEALADFEVDGVPLSVHPRLLIIDPFLPGGHTGIRDPIPLKLNAMSGYTRAKLLTAVQNDVRLIQDNFPGKIVQLGFWKVLDSENATYGGLDAWEWLREELLAEFNDEDRPRVGFFMENLASARALPDAEYTATVTESYGQALYDSREDTFNAFQMLGNWTRPFNDGHVTKTLNGKPYEAMEYGYGKFNSRYTEVYITDVDNEAFVPGLQGWHDFLATLAAPTGLNALADSTTEISVEWDAVAGATSYALERRVVGGSFSQVYTGTSLSYADTGLSAATKYVYRVNATTSAGTTAFSGSFPAVTQTELALVSIAGEDGWVRESSETSNVGGTINATAKLLLGDSGSNQQYVAIVSFDTSVIPSGATVTSATLRLRRNGLGNTNPFTTHGTCLVDVSTGGFGGSTALASGDFEASATATAVATMSSPAADGDFSTGSLDGAGIAALNSAGTTQFRIYFTTDDNNDNGYDLIDLNAGDDATPAYRPELLVVY